MGRDGADESATSLEGRPSSLSSGYVAVGDLRPAYEVSGSGPPLVFAGSSFTNMEALWDDPEAALFFNRWGDTPSKAWRAIGSSSSSRECCRP